MPFSVREGINIFLAGFIPTENLRFRDEELNFKMATSTEMFDNPGRTHMYHYPAMTKSMKTTGTDGGFSGTRTFTLHVDPGSFTDSEIIVMLGENGTGEDVYMSQLLSS
jgi:ATP-binding cassette subfamily E protein 1